MFTNLKAKLPAARRKAGGKAVFHSPPVQFGTAERAKPKATTVSRAFFAPAVTFTAVKRPSPAAVDAVFHGPAVDFARAEMCAMLAQTDMGRAWLSKRGLKPAEIEALRRSYRPRA